jgi:translation initiation factor 2 gamma subunit (eIF-2gamma)
VPQGVFSNVKADYIFGDWQAVRDTGTERRMLSDKGRRSNGRCVGNQINFYQGRTDATPNGFAPLKITAEGAGKFCFSTTGSKEGSDIAQDLLNSALLRARELYASTAPEVEGAESAPQTDSCTEQSPSQPSMNIGLIGDVANGKSTMIRAITGKRTQSHSSEQQKHGMTIRLGFANASVLLCKQTGACGLYLFRQDEILGELGKQPVCAGCNGPATVATRVCFIDCPGHAELMATMLSGASAFDAVILAAAANTPCPSPQAPRQHLDALQASGRDFQGCIAIAQTKAELLVRVGGDRPGETLPEGKLAAHASTARGNLRKTLASDTPFFPMCAPLGVGLEPLAAWLANLALKGQSNLSKLGQRVFRTLRSFDVNFSGTKATELVGGVLGGSISGPGSFTRGETLEIRPGLTLPANRDKTQTPSRPSKAVSTFDDVCPL